MSFGDRVRERRLKLEMTQEQLAEKVGFSQQALQKIEEGKTSRSKFINEICEALQTTADYLYNGHGNVEEVGGLYITAKRLPMLSRIQAGDWLGIVDDFQPGDADEWLKTTAKVSQHAFALKVQGDSMTNPHAGLSIPEGMIVIVDPEVPAENGKIVVAKLKSSQEATLKKLVIDGERKYLKPLNPTYENIYIDDDCIIVGVVVKIEMDI